MKSLRYRLNKEVFFMKTVVILKTEILSQNWRYTNLRDSTRNRCVLRNSGVLAHHFISQNKKNTPVRHFQNVKVSEPEREGIRSPRLGAVGLQTLRQQQPPWALSSSIFLFWLRQKLMTAVQHQHSEKHQSAEKHFEAFTRPGSRSNPNLEQHCT